MPARSARSGLPAPGSRWFSRATVSWTRPPRSPPAWIFAALGVTLTAIVGALGIGTFRLLRSSGLAAAGCRRGPDPPVLLVTDTLLLLLRSSHWSPWGRAESSPAHSHPIASAAPGPDRSRGGSNRRPCRPFRLPPRSSATGESDRVAVFLAMRQIARRPARDAPDAGPDHRPVPRVLRHFGLVGVARNRAAAATFSVGTTEVVTVTPQGAGLQQAVDRVDPHGRFAMAARRQDAELDRAGRRRPPADLSRILAGRDLEHVAGRTRPARLTRPGRALGDAARRAVEVSLPRPPCQAAGSATRSRPVGVQPAGRHGHRQLGRLRPGACAYPAPWPLSARAVAAGGVRAATPSLRQPPRLGVARVSPTLADRTPGGRGVESRAGRSHVPRMEADGGRL